MQLGTELGEPRIRTLKRMAAQFVGQMPLEEADQREIIAYMLELVDWESGAEAKKAVPLLRLALARGPQTPAARA